MAVTFNESSVAREPLGSVGERQRLLSADHVAGTKIQLDRLTLFPQTTLDLSVAVSDVAWIQVLEGDAVLDCGSASYDLGDTHVAFLPAGFTGTFSTRGGVVYLHAQVPEAAGLDESKASTRAQLRVVDWAKEPVLDSEHDARKRVYIVTPKLFGTQAVKGEIIIYPPNTEASNHHHEGAEHFMYVLKGRGTAYADEKPLPLRHGDVIHYGDCERHYLRSSGSEDMVFAEFFVPGVYKTIWAPGAAICTWSPTGRTVHGDKPVREIAGHSSATATPQDV